MNYTKVPVKGGIVHLPGKWSKAEIAAYTAGKLPELVKVPVNSNNFYGQNKLLKVLGYQVEDLLRATPGSKIFAIYKLND